MVKIFFFVALGVALVALVGGLTALLWNHFPFLQEAHNMSWWDGVLLNILCSGLFRGSVSIGRK